VWPLRSDHSTQFVIECLRCSNQQGEGGPFWIKILGCSVWNRFVWCWGLQRANTQLTNRDITFEQFHRMWSRYFNITDRQLAVAIGEIAYKRCRLKNVICKNERVMFYFNLTATTSHWNSGEVFAETWGKSINFLCKLNISYIGQCQCKRRVICRGNYAIYNSFTAKNLPLLFPWCIVQTAW